MLGTDSLVASVVHLLEHPLMAVALMKTNSFLSSQDPYALIPDPLHLRAAILFYLVQQSFVIPHSPIDKSILGSGLSGLLDDLQGTTCQGG